MKATWVVVAESSRARIFTMEKIKGPMTEILSFDNPTTRQREKEFVTDLSKRSSNSQGHRHGRQDIYEYSETKHQADRFARQIADLLDSHRLTGDYQQLILFAAPSFLGMLRDHMNEPTNRLVVHDCNKNLVQLNIEKIREHIPTPLPHFHV